MKGALPREPALLILTASLPDVVGHTLLNNSHFKQQHISGTERDGNKNKGEKNKNKKLTCSYTPEEWRALAPEQRKKIQEAQAEVKAKRRQDNNNNAKRIMPAVGSGKLAIMKTVIQILI